MTEPTFSIESRWFKIAVFAGSAAAGGVTFANIIYYAKLRKDTKMTAISQRTATTMMWVNIVLFAVMVLLFLWSIWALFFSKAKREAQVSSVTKYATQFLSSDQPLIGSAQPTSALPISMMKSGFTS